MSLAEERFSSPLRTLTPHLLQTPSPLQEDATGKPFLSKACMRLSPRVTWIGGRFLAKEIVAMYLCSIEKMGGASPGCLAMKLQNYKINSLN